MLIDYPASLRHFACTKLRIYFTLTLKCVPVFGIINGRERGRGKKWTRRNGFRDYILACVWGLIRTQRCRGRRIFLHTSRRRRHGT